MRCATHASTRETSSAADAPTPARAPDDRVDAAARDRAAEEVRAAYVDGLLGLAELEDALAAVYASRTAGDLAAATALAPEWWRRERAAARQRAYRADMRRLAWRRSAAVYLAVMALLFGIWIVTASAEGAGHPWFLWPALGWGIPLWASRPSRPGATSTASTP